MRFLKLSTVFHRLLAQNASRHYATATLCQGNEVNNLISQESFEKFEKSLPVIINTVFEANQPLNYIEDRMHKLISYNVAGTKKSRAQLSIAAYQMLEKPDNITEDKMYQLHVRAWATETMNAFFEMLEDLIDESDTRLGNPSWYKVPGVGTLAINDASLLRSLSTEMLKNNISDKSTYIDTLHLFDQAYLTAAVGKHLEVTLSQKKPDNAEFTMKNYDLMVEYKASHFTYKFPIMLAMKLANKSDAASLRYLDDICKNMGNLFQIQNDYVDCYPQAAVAGTGKGRGIARGKCTWLALTALERCNPAQRALFMECYGSKDPAHVDRIKLLYDELHIPQSYQQKRQMLHDNIVSMTQVLSDRTALNPEIFVKVLDTVEQQYEK